ncbi:MAG: DUF4932 domain-containing protein [Kofleriaceae bacterium]
MRLLWVIAVVACSSKPSPAPITAATTDVGVDRRIELLSIVNRLGGGDEYRQAPASPYVAEVDRVFQPFAGHSAIAATTALRKTGIAYDAPIVLAVHLDDQLAIDDAGIAAVRAADARWNDADVAGYVAQLRAFASASSFDAFFTAHAAHHAAVAGKLRAVVDAEQPVAWFDSQFGARSNTRYRVVPGLLNGSRNCGVQRTLGTTREMYQVLGVSGSDGMPTVDDDTVGLLVHEMAHSYVNPLFELHAAKLERAGTAIFPLVERRMIAQQYATWQIMLNEAGVRALTVLYMGVNKGPEAGRIAIRQELRRGFVWTDELAGLLDKRDPRQHATIEAYLPVIIAWFDQLAARYAKEGLRKLPFLGPVFAVPQAPTTWSRQPMPRSRATSARFSAGTTRTARWSPPPLRRSRPRRARVSSRSAPRVPIRSSPPCSRTPAGRSRGRASSSELASSWAPTSR